MDVDVDDPYSLKSSVVFVFVLKYPIEPTRATANKKIVMKKI